MASFLESLGTTYNYDDAGASMQDADTAPDMGGMLADSRYDSIRTLPDSVWRDQFIAGSPGGWFDQGEMSSYVEPTQDRTESIFDLFSQPGGQGFQSKFYRGFEASPDRNTVMAYGLQNPGENKYNTINAVWQRDPTTGQYTLSNVMGQPQASSLRTHGKGLATLALAMYGAGGVAGALGAGGAGAGAASGGMSAADMAAMDAAMIDMGAGAYAGMGSTAGSTAAGVGGAAEGVTAADAAATGSQTGSQYGNWQTLKDAVNVGKHLGLEGAQANAVNSSLTNMGSTAVQGGDTRDILKAGAIGALGAYMPDVAGYAGIDNPALARGVNAGVQSGVGSALMGGDWKQAALMGALDSQIPSLDSMFSDTSTQSPYTLNNARLGETSMDSSPYSLGSARFGDRAPVETNMYSPAYTPTATLGGGASNYQQTAPQAQPQAGANDNPFMSTIQEYLGGVTPSQIGNFGQGLMGMYEGYQQRRSAKDMMKALGGRRGAYEQQLQKDLLRRDAAAGRRSNYGGRSVELQSLLAQLDSRNAPMMTQLQQMSQGGLANMFRSGLRMGDKMGWFRDAPQQQGAPFLPSLASYNQPFQPNYSFSTPSLNPQSSGSMYDLGRRRFGD